MPQYNSRVALHLNLFQNQLLNTAKETERDRERQTGWVQRREAWDLSKNYGFAASVAVAFEFEIWILAHAKR